MLCKDFINVAFNGGSVRGRRGNDEVSKFGILAQANVAGSRRVVLPDNAGEALLGEVFPRQPGCQIGDRPELQIEVSALKRSDPVCRGVMQPQFNVRGLLLERRNELRQQIELDIVRRGNTENPLARQRVELLGPCENALKL